MPNPSPTKRDPHIDFLRGVALLTIFIDHVPGNFLGTLTLRNFGFSDAAELFVLLSGFSAMIAYGRVFERARPGMGWRRVVARCLRIDIFQSGLLLTTLAIFPLFWIGIRRWPAATMLASTGMWIAVNLDPGINLMNWMDGQGWYFDPFAWQFCACPRFSAEKPDLVIWQTGSNDPLRDVPLECFVAKTRAGIAAIRAAGVDVMLMGPQLCARLQSTAGADRYRLALRQIGAEMGVPVIRRFDLMRAWLHEGRITRAALMAGDGLHMADAGYAMLATEVAREIRAAAR